VNAAVQCVVGVWAGLAVIAAFILLAGRKRAGHPGLPDDGKGMLSADDQRTWWELVVRFHAPSPQERRRP
jgi:hypothetical protein